MLFEVKFAFGVDISEACVYILQSMLNFHEVFVAQVNTIHDIFHIVVMSLFLLCEGLLLNVSLRLRNREIGHFRDELVCRVIDGRVVCRAHVKFGKESIRHL